MDVYRVAPLAAPLDAVVHVPGSKSVANRVLVCTALAEGRSTVHDVPAGDDTEAMLDCLRVLGIEADRDVDTGTVVVDGGRSHLRKGPLTLPTRIAGTTSRFLTALSALGPGPYTIDGLAPLRRRPMAELHDALSAMGARVTPLGEPGHLPVTVEGPVGGDADGVSLRGDVSSQYLTALMLIAPYLPSGLRLELTTPLVSRPYVRITAAVMAEFGIDGIELGDRIITVPPGQYVARDVTVEPDASSAGYPLAAAAICGGTVLVPGLTDRSMQGDAAFCHVLARMGCEVEQGPSGTRVTRRGPLRGIDIDMVDMSDLVPTLAAVAAFADSTTTVRGVGFIRGKESDRIGDLCSELRRAGVDAVELDDGLEIRPSEPHTATLATHHDHRLAMAFALVGLGASGIVVEDPDVVGKSWPDFWSMIEGLR